MGRIYSRTGDQGTTRLGSGQRIDKNSTKVHAYGTLYELNTFIGSARSQIRLARPADPPEEWTTLEFALRELQHRLFEVGRDISGRKRTQDPQPTTTPEMTKKLEVLVDQLRKATPPWKPFTLPEGTPAATGLYMATTVCRRAERLILGLHKVEPVPHAVLTFMNRLSDVLFASARYVNHVLGFEEEKIREPIEY